MAVEDASKFRLSIIGRFRAHLPGNESHVFDSVLAGPDWDHLSLSGTLTLSVAQYRTLADALKEAIGDAVELEEDLLPVEG